VDGTPPTWSTAQVAVFNWTHETVSAYSAVTAATLRVRITAVDPAGFPVSQHSIEYTFSDVSPSIARLVDAVAGYETSGGASLSFEVLGLAATQQLNVSVGPTLADLLDSSGAVIPAAQARDRVVVAQGVAFNYPPFPPDFRWTVRIRIPEGQGTSQAVQVFRDGVGSDLSYTINYLPPTVTQVRLGGGKGDGDVPLVAQLRAPGCVRADWRVERGDGRLRHDPMDAVCAAVCADAGRTGAVGRHQLWPLPQPAVRLPAAAVCGCMPRGRGHRAAEP